MPYSRLSSDISAVLPINIGPSFLYVIASYIIPSYNIASYNVIRQAAHAKGAVHHRTWTVPENVSRSGAKNWAIVSVCSPIGKAHPALRARSGMQFPFEARSGNGIPLWGRNLGHSFRRYKTTIRSSYHMPSNMRSRNTKQQIECSFSEKYTSRNLPRLHNSLPFTVADYRPQIWM